MPARSSCKSALGLWNLSWSTARTAVAFALRTLLRINADVLAPHGWLMAVDENDDLVLSTSLAPYDSHADTTRSHVINSFERAQEAAELWNSLMTACVDAESRPAMPAHTI
jgi:hypothetical protein